MKPTYFVEIVCSKTKYLNHSQYLRAIIVANSQDEAKEIALNHYRPYYDNLEKEEGSRFNVQCCWLKRVPTLKVVKELINELGKITMPIPVRAGSGETIGHRHPKLYDKNDNIKKEIIDGWKRINYQWSDVYYEPSVGGYVVTINPYMCDDITVKVFEGKTESIYNEACKWVEKNTMQRNYFAFKFAQ